MKSPLNLKLKKNFKKEKIASCLFDLAEPISFFHSVFCLPDDQEAKARSFLSAAARSFLVVAEGKQEVLWCGGDDDVVEGSSNEEFSWQRPVSAFGFGAAFGYS